MTDIVDPFGGNPPASGSPIVDPFAAQGAPVPAPAPSNGALNEIGTGLARGALVDLPTLVGQAAQYIGATPVGNALTGFGQRMGARPALQMNPAGHGAIVNALASGAEALPAIGGTIAAGLAAVAAAPVDLPALAGLGIAAVPGAALFAGQAGQQTLDAAKAKGVAPDDAAAAARLNAAATFASQVGLGMAGGKVLGAAGSALGRATGRAAAPLATDVLGEMTGQGGILAPVLKNAAVGGAEAVGAGALQAGTTAAINNAYGIDDTSPLEAAKEQIGPMLGLSAMLTPFGLAGRALQMRAAANRTTLLAHPDTSPAVRATLADQYAQQLGASGNPQDVAAAQAFRQNAQTAIDNKQPLPVTTELFQANAIQPPEAPQPPQPTLALPAPSNIVFPDGTVARNQQEADSYINSLPENEQVAARARLYGMGAQPATAEAPTAPRIENNPSPTPMGASSTTPRSYTFPDGSATNDFGQVQAYLEGLPAEQRAAARAKIFGFEPQANTYDAAQVPRQAATEAMRQITENPNPDLSAKQAIETVTGVDRAGLSKQEQAKRQADAKAALSEPSGVRVNDENGHERELSMGELYALRNQQAKEAEAVRSAPNGGATQETPGNAPSTSATVPAVAASIAEPSAALSKPAQAMKALAPKDASSINADVDAVNQAQGFSTKPQSMVPFQKIIDKLGLDDMHSHQQQIDAVEARLADKQSPIKQGVLRDRLQALVDTWKAAAPSAEDRQQALLGNIEEAAQPRPMPLVGGGESKIMMASRRVSVLHEMAAAAQQQGDTTRVADLNAIHDEVFKRQQVQDAANRQQSMLKGAKAELDAAVRSGRVTMDQAAQITGDARATGNAVDAAFHVQDSLDAANLALPAPTQAEALPANIPVAAPDTAPPPAAAETLGENIPASRDEHIATALDTLNAKIVGLQDRQRAGETLPEADQDALNDARAQRQIIANAATQPEARVNAALRAINGVEPPDAVFRHYRADKPEDVDPAIMYDAMRTGQLPDTLNTIAENGSTDYVKSFAKRLAGLTQGTTIRYADPNGSGAVGQFNLNRNHVDIYPGGESEQTILHEAVHAATSAQIARAEQMAAPRTQADARLKAAYSEIESIRRDLSRRTSAATQYGLTDAHEFIAELTTNPDFQDYLRNAASGKQTMWGRVVSAVKRLLGLPAGGDYLERALAVGGEFFHKSDPNAAGFPLRAGTPEETFFRKSPAAAAKVTDDQYTKLTGLADKALAAIPGMKHASLAAYQKMLGWVTKQYIVSRLESTPEMVQSGMAAAAAAHYKADETKHVVSDLVGHPLSDFISSGRKLFAGFKDADKARALSQQMKIIGAEASRGGFDFRLNYNDNVKAGRQLPPENKAYIDDIHRQYTQMQRNNPEAAKAIETGALQNARLNTMRMAVLARNLIGASKDATMAAHAGALDIMDPTLKAGRNTNAAMFADGAHNTLHSRLEAAFADARAKLPEGSVLRSQMNELSDMYHAQQRDPYFSLGRDGDYFVKVGFQNMDRATADRLQAIALQHGHVLGDLMGDADHAFFRVETLDEATGLRQKLLAAGGDKIAPNSPASGKLADQIDSAYGVSPALRSILTSLHDTVEQAGITGDAAAAVRDTITRQVLAMLPETSSRSAKMQRRGVPGYSADFLGDFQKRAAGGVQDLSNMYMQPAYTAARDAMAAAVEKLARSGNAEMQTRAQMAADEIDLRHTQAQKPLDNTMINTINSLGHTFYLAMSPAYLIRTTAQPFHRGVPITGARFGFVKASRSMAGATATALKVIQNTIADGYSAAGMRGVLDADASFKNLGLPANEQAFIQELHDRGTLNLGQSRQIQSMPLKGSQRQQDLQRFAAMTAQYAEMGNRLVVALSAFRLAEADNAVKGITDHAGSTEWAIKVAKQAMDDFEPTNTARQIGKFGFAGKGTPLVTAFMNYSLQTMQQIARTVHDGMFSGAATKVWQDRLAENPNDAEAKAGLAATQQRAKEARREFAGLMATTTMISGALGLPFASVFAGLWNTFNDLTDPDNPGDIRISAQEFLNNTFGHTVGDVLAHGMPRAVGFDSSTFGLENLLPGSEFLSSRRLLGDRIDELGKSMMGPALSAGVQLFEAADKIKDGYVAKGIEAALPSGLKPYFKAAELATQGFTDSKGNPIGLDATPWDIGVQAIGFKSAKAATQSELQSFVSARQDRLNYQRGLVQDQLYKGTFSGNPDTMTNAMSALARYNEANPTQMVAPDMVRQAITERMRNLALAQSMGGVSFPIRQLPVLGGEVNSINGAGMP